MLNTSSNATNLPLKVGLTGGIGSGKSLVCSIFRILHIPVFEADREAKIIMESDREVRSALIELLGSRAYNAGGTPDRKWLAEKIFKDKDIIEKVNSIIHPVVRRSFSAWWKKQHSPYVVHEAAILFESGAYELMDINVLVTAPVEMRIKRVMLRDGISREQVEVRMNNQWPDTKKRGLANFIILNDESEFLVSQVLDLHKKILNYGKVC
jgi:dephospho-CoA kinase